MEDRVQPCTFVPFYTHRVQEHTMEEIFDYPFFRSIRDRQPYHSNLFRACTIIDHPEDLRERIHGYRARPWYDGEEKIVTCDTVKRSSIATAGNTPLADRAWNVPDVHCVIMGHAHRRRHSP